MRMKHSMLHMALAPIWGGALAREDRRDARDGRCPQGWTACKACQSILVNLLRPGRSAPAGVGCQARPGQW